MIITVIYYGQKKLNFTGLSMTQNNFMHQMKGTFSEDVPGQVFRLANYFFAVIRTIKYFGHSHYRQNRNQTNQEQTRQMAGA